jgi:hypothetical protein
MKKKKYSDKYENFNISEALEKLLSKRRAKEDTKNLWNKKKK